MSTSRKVVSSSIEMAKPTVIAESPQIPPQFSRTDFTQALKKVSRKLDSPIGENVRSTVRALKGRKARGDAKS